MHFRKHLSEPWFSFVAQGLKTIEGRLNKGDFRKMKEGDTITFFNNNREVTVRVIAKKYYPTFKRMLALEDKEKVLPSCSDMNIYYKYYTKEEEKKYGVVALFIDVC